MLKPTKIVDKGEFYISPSGKKILKWLAVLGSGKGKERSMSFDGIANAFGDQWGDENRLPTPVEQLSLF